MTTACAMMAAAPAATAMDAVCASGRFLCAEISAEISRDQTRCARLGDLSPPAFDADLLTRSALARRLGRVPVAAEDTRLLLLLRLQLLLWPAAIPLVVVVVRRSRGAKSSSAQCCSSSLPPISRPSNGCSGSRCSADGSSAATSRPPTVAAPTDSCPARRSAPGMNSRGTRRCARTRRSTRPRRRR